MFAAIRDEPGNVSVKIIGQETFKLGAIRAVGLPDDLFADVAPKVLAGWRARVAAEAPSHLRSHPHEIMVTLLAAYLYCRYREAMARAPGEACIVSSGSVVPWLSGLRRPPPVREQPLGARPVGRPVTAALARFRRGQRRGRQEEIRARTKGQRQRAPRPSPALSPGSRLRSMPR